MPEYNKRFIALSMQSFLDKNGLVAGIKYLDILTYVTLRSFNNSDNDECFPSYQALASKSGMCRTFITESIKRLQKIGVIDILEPDSNHPSNRYFFEKFKHFERIPYEIFAAEDLSSNEKAMLLCIRLFSDGINIYKPAGLKDILGLTYNTVHPLFKSLKEKGYIGERKKKIKKKTYKSWFFTDKINWLYRYDEDEFQEPFKLKIA